MRPSTYALSTALLFADRAVSQFVTHTSGNYGIAVNVPASTAATNNGSIYFQMSAPSGTQWFAFGQGSQMAGANMFVVYANGQSVVLSPRRGRGHVMPNYDATIQATLLDGSGVNNDGSLVANVQCDSCLSWNGGSMDPTSTSAAWIMAYRTGNALDTGSQSASIVQHNTHSSFILDLTAGTGGNTNPFTTAASATGTGTGTSTTATAVSSPVTSSNPNSGSSTTISSSDDGTSMQLAHGVIMSLLFVGLFPLAAMTVYLPSTKRVRFIHAPLQVLNLILLIVGLALGVTYGKRIDMVTATHQKIGYVVVAFLLVVVPALGLFQHIRYHRGLKSATGPGFIVPIHQWVGRALLVLGLANGGYGWTLTDKTSAYVPYGVLAGIVYVAWIGLAAFRQFRSPKKAGREHTAPTPKEGSEMTQS